MNGYGWLADVCQRSPWQCRPALPWPARNSQRKLLFLRYAPCPSLPLLQYEYNAGGEVSSSLSYRRAGDGWSAAGPRCAGRAPLQVVQLSHTGRSFSSPNSVFTSAVRRGHSPAVRRGRREGEAGFYGEGTRVDHAACRTWRRLHPWLARCCRPRVRPGSSALPYSLPSPCPPLPLQGRDFSKQDLQRSNFTSADARDANFAGSNLQARPPAAPAHRAHASPPEGGIGRSRLRVPPCTARAFSWCRFGRGLSLTPLASSPPTPTSTPRPPPAGRLLHEGGAGAHQL